MQGPIPTASGRPVQKKGRDTQRALQPKERGYGQGRSQIAAQQVRYDQRKLKGLNYLALIVIAFKKFKKEKSLNGCNDIF